MTSKSKKLKTLEQKTAALEELVSFSFFRTPDCVVAGQISQILYREALSDFGIFSSGPGAFNLSCSSVRRW